MSEEKRTKEREETRKGERAFVGVSKEKGNEREGGREQS